MLEILKYILGDFWHFLETLILIAVTGEVLADTVRAATPDYRPEIHVCPKCKEEHHEHTDNNKIDS